MTLGDWLATRTPPPPPALAARLGELLGGDLDASQEEIPERCLAAAERVLAALIEPGENGGRPVVAASRRRVSHRGLDAALDLLAADALVTYAFEAAADDLATLEQRATAAMHRIASLVPEESRA